MKPEEKTQKLLEIRDTAQADFYYFARNIIGLDKLVERYHGALCRRMQSRRRQMILWPRGTYKSTISMAYALWLVVNNPEHRILIACDTTDVAVARLAVLKSWMERNELLRALWPEIFWENPQGQAPRWAEKAATVRRKGTYTEATFEAGGVDVNIVGRHYTAAVLDDLVTMATVETDRAIQKTINYYQLLRPVFLPGGVDGKGFLELIDGTRWHDNELYGWILENDRDVIPDIRGILDDDNPEETILGPDFTIDQLRSIRSTMTAYQFSCQYENSPISSDTAMFKQDDIAPMKYRTLPTGIYLCTVTMDPARKAGKSSDRTAITCRLLDHSGHWWIEKEWAGRLLLAGRARRLFEFCAELDGRNFHPVMVGIEDPDGMDIPAFRDEMAKNQKWWSVVEIRHRGRTKESRVGQIQAIAEAHRLHLREEMKELESELYRFPHGRYDDRADSLSMHYELEVSSPSVAKQALPYLCPDAIAERVARRTTEAGRMPIGSFFDSNDSPAVQESWIA